LEKGKEPKIEFKREIKQMIENKLEIKAMNRDNIFDRLKLCWGHLDNWRNLEIVKKK
jgi:hypothetical protein